MLSPRWRKVGRDLWSNKARTLLVVLAIAVGVQAFGGVFITQELLIANMQKQFKESKGSTITLFLGEFDDEIVTWAERQRGVKSAMGRASQSVKLVQEGGKEENLTLLSVPSYPAQKLNLLLPQSGAWPPGKGELLVERSAKTAIKGGVGEKITIKIGERERELTFAGTVYDNGAFPYMFTNQIGGYIDWETLSYLGLPKRYSQLEIATGEEITTLAEAERLAYDLGEELKKRGIEVRGSLVFPPNEHWAEKNSRAFTAILSTLGVFSLVLSGFLVVNTISALLSQQKKQIGIMQAIGGRRGQVIWLYLAMVGVYGTLALFLALPLSMMMGYVSFMAVAGFLNLDMQLIYLPKQVLLMEIAASLAIPLAAATLPILAGAKRTIRESLSDYLEVRRTSKWEHALSHVRGMGRPMLLSLRNVFRKTGRLMLTLGTLVTAGALFMAVLNTRQAMYLEIDRLLTMFNFQVAFNLARDYEVSGLLNRVEAIEHVSQVEARTSIAGRRIKEDGSLGSGFNIVGLPPETEFSSPEMVLGRWLVKGDTNVIVLGSTFYKNNLDLSIGDDFYVDFGEKKRHLTVVGIVVTSSEDSSNYMSFESVAALKDKPGVASSVLVKTEPSDGATQDKVAKETEERLKRSAVLVAGHQTRSLIERSAAGQFNFMVAFLLSMALMVAVVGGLGLAGTMSLNVMERTREIGIIRSIGARDSAVAGIVIVEGVVVAILSFVLALPLSILLTYGLGYAIGQAFFSRPLLMVVEPSAILIWLAIVLVVAIVASWLPAKRAVQMSISETLAYE